MRARLLSLVLVLASSFLALGIAEWAMRHSGLHQPAIYEPDSVLIYRLHPGGAYRVRQPTRLVEVRVNSAGNRGPELAPRDGRVRVVVYGDSFIQAEATPEDSTFVVTLGRSLPFRADAAAEVVNAGVVGYGPDQEWLRMRRELTALAPDAVVFALFPYNDFGDLIRNRKVRLDAEGQIVLRRAVFADTLARQMEQALHPTGWERSHLLAYLAPRVRRRVARVFSPPPAPPERNFVRESLDSVAYWHGRYLAGDSVAGAEVKHDSFDAWVAIFPDSAVSRTAVALMRAVLRAVAADARAADIPIVVMVVPAPSDICPNYLEHVDSLAWPTYRRERLTDLASSLAREAGLTVVNLWQPFLSSNPCSLYIGSGDNHWNGAGQLLGARLVAAAMDSLALLRVPAAARK